MRRTLTVAHRFRVLLWRVFRRGSFRDVLPLLVLALAARALPERNVQAVEPQAEQKGSGRQQDCLPA